MIGGMYWSEILVHLFVISLIVLIIVYLLVNLKDLKK